MSSIQVQSSPTQQLALPRTPTIRIHKPTLGCLPLPIIPEVPLGTPEAPNRTVTEGVRSSVREGRVQRRQSLRRQTKTPTALPSHMVKEILQSKLSNVKDQDKKKTDPEKDRPRKMTSPSPRMSSASSKSTSPEASPTATHATLRSKSKKQSKDVDWTDITDPEERRRIQNRIAQRKFREKTRDNREKAEREARNQQHAGNSYRIPTAEDFLNDAESEGLPWGGLNFGHAVLRGHESEGRRSSGRGTYVADSPLQTQPPVLAPVSAPAPFLMPYPQALPQAAPSFGSSGAEDVYMEEAQYGYGPVLQTYRTLPPH